MSDNTFRFVMAIGIAILILSLNNLSSQLSDLIQEVRALRKRYAPDPDDQDDEIET